MFRLIAHRILLSIPLLFVVSALTFVLLRLVPGDAARQYLGPIATPEEIATLRHQLGIDRPLPTQYWDWLTGALHGDLGTSLFGGSVVSILNARLAVTMSLILGAVTVTAALGIGLGVASAVRGGVLGRAIDAISIATFGIPGFWLASLLVEGLAVSVQSSLRPATYGRAIPWSSGCIHSCFP